MDSELTSIASVKALDQGVATTDSPTFAGLTVDTTTLAVDSTNNRVGIGTASPSAPLHVKSSGELARLETTSSGGNNYLAFYKPSDARKGFIGFGGGDSDNKLYINNDENADILFRPNNSEAMRILADGKVGIGTDSPAKLLDISSNSAPTIRLSNTRNDSNWTADPVFGALEFYSADVSGSGASVRASVKAEAATAFGNATELVFRNGDANGVQQENLRIDYFGNVGIGTSSPSKKLVVNENDSECVAIIKSSDTGTAGLYLGGQSDEIKGGIVFDNSDNSLQLRGHNNSEHLRITSDGVVEFKAGITENSEFLSGTSTTIDLSTSTNFVHTLTGNTTYTFSNSAASGNTSSFTLKIAMGSPASTVTWPSNVDWAGGTAPTLSSTNFAVDIFTFVTFDGGLTYYGFTAGQAMA
jgi:hypothetical protein